MSSIIGRRLPIVLVAITSTIGLLDYFFPATKTETPITYVIFTNLTNMGTIVVGFTFFMMAINFFMLQGKHIVRKAKGEWYFAAYALALFVIYSVTGLLPPMQKHPLFLWIYNNMYYPLSATMMGILAFSIIGGAIRTFRARTFEAGLLMLAAMLVWMNTAPIGAIIHPMLPSFGQWIIDVPNLAANRGLLICVAVGTIAMGLRQMAGMEKAYIGVTA